MKNTLSIALFMLLAATVQAETTSLPSAPSEQELIERQTELGATRRKELMPVWGLLDLLKPRNQCKYAIRVPDQITRGTISLTFDDGPSPSTTPKILDILKAHNAKGTFFILGSKIKGNEELIQRILNEGHQIGNHSYSHPNFHQLSVNQATTEIENTDRLLRKFNAPLYFRYPYGNSSCEANDQLKTLGYQIVGWNIDTCDWAYADGRVSDRENETCQAPENLRSDYAHYVIQEVEKTQGGVLLMHDIHRNTADNLDRLLTLLEDANYRFVGLDDRNIFPKLNNR